MAPQQLHWLILQPIQIAVAATIPFPDQSGQPIKSIFGPVSTYVDFRWIGERSVPRAHAMFATCAQLTISMTHCRIAGGCRGDEMTESGYFATQTLRGRLITPQAVINDRDIRWIMAM